MGSPGIGSFGAKRAPVPADAIRMPPAAAALPTEAYTARTSVRDQGPIGSCTGFAFRTALNILHGGGLEISPGALYYVNRRESGFQPHQDSGAYMEPSARALKKYGAGSEALHPYDLPISEKPSIEYQAQALDHLVMEYYRTLTVQQYRTAIANGLPVVLSFDVPPGFAEVGETGVWNDNGGPALGGHAVCGVGYDDARGALIQNSWGEEWGTVHADDAVGMPEGFFWVPYEVLTGPRWWDGFTITTWDLEAGR